MYRVLAIILPLCLLTLAGQGAAAVTYELHVLERIGDGGHVAEDINNLGQVVGTSAGHAVLWNRGASAIVLQDGTAMAINDSGQILTGLGPWAYVWDNGVRVSLDPGPDTGGFYAHDMDRFGRVVGNESNPGAGPQEACLWDNGGLRFLGVPDGRLYSSAHAINSHGHVVGLSQGDGLQAFCWSESQGMTPLPMIDATDINDGGEAVGTSSGQAAIWRASEGLRLLPALPGYAGGAARGINNLSQVVGCCSNAVNEGTAFVWSEADGIRALPSLGGIETQAIRINDLGQIVGFSRTPDGEQYPVLWTPVPEPSSALALVSGIGSLVWMLRRRSR